MKEISSAANARFKRWLSLTSAEGIKSEGRALLSGAKIVAEILKQSPDQIEEILLPPKAEPMGDWPHTRLTAPLFKSLDVIGTKHALAVVRTPEQPAWDGGPPQGLELILSLSDPANLGSCLRSAEAFGVRRAILTEECSSPFLPKALKASSGSSLRLPLAKAGPLAELPIAQGIGLDMNGTDLAQFEWPQNAYLVLGEEGRGLPATLGLNTIRIPMQDPVESLNATVAAAIAMYSYGSSLSGRAAGSLPFKKRRSQ